MEASAELQVKLRGRGFQVSQNEAMEILKNMALGPAKRKGKAPSYFVVVNGKRIPIKQALKFYYFLGQ